MTNREWLATLSNEDLSKMMQACAHCIYRITPGEAVTGGHCKGSELKNACILGAIQWLESEHTPVDDEELISFKFANSAIKKFRRGQA